eukprot:6805845-Ditylum_brightwellii.AAC.1
MKVVVNIRLWMMNALVGMQIALANEGVFVFGLNFTGRGHLKKRPFATISWWYNLSARLGVLWWRIIRNIHMWTVVAIFWL